MTMEMTKANFGRVMKNLEMGIGCLPQVAGRLRSTSLTAEMRERWVGCRVIECWAAPR
jgi:hypothetical protein